MMNGLDLRCNQHLQLFQFLNRLNFLNNIPTKVYLSDQTKPLYNDPQVVPFHAWPGAGRRFAHCLW